MEYWAMSGLFSSSARTVISTSSRWYIHETVMTSWEMVAENRPMVFLCLSLSRMWVTSLKKPISSIRSASSSTTVWTLSRRRVWRL